MWSHHSIALRLQSNLLAIEKIWNDESFFVMSYSTYWRSNSWERTRGKIVTLGQHQQSGYPPSGVQSLQVLYHGVLPLAWVRGECDPYLTNHIVGEPASTNINTYDNIDGKRKKEQKTRAWSNLGSPQFFLCAWKEPVGRHKKMLTQKDQ